MPAPAPRAETAQGDAVSRRLTWSMVFGVALSLAVLIASGDSDPIANLLHHNIGSLALKLALVIFAGGLVLTLFRERLSKALEAMAFWAVIGFLLVVGYTYRFELSDATDRVVAQLMPGHVAGHGLHAGHLAHDALDGGHTVATADVGNGELNGIHG